MDASYRLARKILLHTCIVLCVVAILLCAVLIVNFLSEISARLVASLAWSPDGKTLASANIDGTLSLWGANCSDFASTCRGNRISGVARNFTNLLLFVYISRRISCGQVSHRGQLGGNKNSIPFFSVP
jgi:WD40 repeat protein